MIWPFHVEKCTKYNWGFLLHQRSLKPLCETRWTCRTSSLCSILDNYEVILKTLEEITKSGGSTKGAKESPQLLCYLEKFSTVFGLKMCLLLFSPTENMVTQLQSKQLDASAIKTIKGGILRHLKDMRSDSYFKDNVPRARIRATDSTKEDTSTQEDHERLPWGPEQRPWMRHPREIL